jgi:hypothetical protein
MVGPLFEVAVGEYLKVDQAKADYAEPKHQKAAEQVQPELRAVAGRIRGHLICP